MSIQKMNAIRDAVLKAGGTYAQAAQAVIEAVQAEHKANAKKVSA